jgi:hypothetical protein
MRCTCQTVKKCHVITKKMTCHCINCLIYINTTHTDPWVVYMQNMIRNGNVAHIGFDEQKRPLFRVVK